MYREQRFWRILTQNIAQTWQIVMIDYPYWQPTANHRWPPVDHRWRHFRAANLVSTGEHRWKIFQKF